MKAQFNEQNWIVRKRARVPVIEYLYLVSLICNEKSI